MEQNCYSCNETFICKLYGMKSAKKALLYALIIKQEQKSEEKIDDKKIPHTGDKASLDRCG